MDRAAENASVEGLGHSPRLVEALSGLWQAMADDYGLVPELPFDAVSARARSGDEAELARCLPRLVTLMVDYELAVAQAIEIIELLSLPSWTDHQRHLLIKVLDAWWFEILIRNPGEHPPDYQPDDVLGLLSRTEARMVRRLQVWLSEIDGPPAVHLATALLEGFDGSAWDGQDDARGQVLAWARSETVVNGLALIGTTHLEPEMMSAVLDRLLDEVGSGGWGS